jgi:hypothetical protein
MKKPARTPATEQAYAARALQLFQSIEKDHDAKTGSALSVKQFVEFFIAKNGDYRPSSWRFNRRSICFALEEKAKLDPKMADEIALATARLIAVAAPAKDPDAERRTSSHRQKSFPPDDAERVEHLALTRRSPTAPKLVKFIHAGLLTGLRPCEWPSAELSMTEDPAARWVVRAENAKQGNNRALGTHRELRFRELPRDLAEEIVDCIDLARRPDYARLRGTMSDLLSDLTLTLWPRRERRPDLYSVRHETIRRWKAAFLRSDQTVEERLTGLAIIAALSGHLTDESASKHYGRPSPGRDRKSPYPVPLPAPERILEVRRAYKIDIVGLGARDNNGFAR